eukprot:TRINITY_DN6001_c0_g1_i1.p1 TRINITY_DN6001_c0_g1~~TRINITY_DN6001_c0_g1_i1.p1  ORF type:complete len:200 (+),score=56.68 TRINITY_DN6001_c0_g1_i1:122-721(+)
MGCCQSGNAPEEEVPAKRTVPSERQGKGSEDLTIGLIQAEGEGVPGAEEDEEEAVKEATEKYVVNDELDTIVANGWKYFVIDSTNNFPGEDELEEEGDDWTHAHNPKLVPPQGLPCPASKILGTVKALPEQQALAHLAACAPIPDYSNVMIEYSNQVSSTLASMALLPHIDESGAEVGIVANVTIDDLAQTTNATENAQ